MRSLVRIFCVGLVCVGGLNLHAGVNFGDRRSAIKVSGSSTFNVNSGDFAVEDGSFIKGRSADVTGNSIDFDRGIFSGGGADVLMTGRVSPSNSVKIVLKNGDVFTASPGFIYERIFIEGDNTRIDGQPVFMAIDPIVVQDHTSSLTLAIQSPLNKNLLLNNGKLVLGSDLSLGEDVIITESGRIQSEGHMLSLGTKDLTLSSSLYWDHLADIVLRSDVRLTGEWTFNGNNKIVGNGFTLDLTNGGTLFIKRNSMLALSNVKVKGLGTGNISFEDKTSQLRLSEAKIEMDRSHTVSTGGWYVAGPSTVVVKDFYLMFDLLGSLTVDGVVLYYENSSFNDRENIRPRSTDPENAGNKFVTYLGDGTVQLPRGWPIGPIYPTAATNFLTTDVGITPMKQLIAEQTLEFDGRGYSLIFSKSDSETIEIDAGIDLTVKNIVLDNFSPDYVDIGNGGQLLYADRTFIRLGESEELTYTWTFFGECSVDGRGKFLDLRNIGNIVIMPSSSLLLQNVIIKGVSGSQIRCIDDTSTLSLQNVTFVLDGDFSFTKGHFEVLPGIFDVISTATFFYQTSQTSSVYRRGGMLFGSGATFRYDPPIPHRDLIWLEDVKAEFELSNGSLSSSTTGMRLTRGNLLITGECFFENIGAVAESEAIGFGNGNDPDDLTVTIGSGATMELLSGLVVYNQAE